MEVPVGRSYLRAMTLPQNDWSREEVDEIRSRLLEGFDERNRSLPWREEPTPYRILVSEVMSQQTRLETVIPYYLRWLERFPDFSTLAAASQEQVLSSWQGLGYYSRARNLHQAAREVEARYEGELPREPEALRSLPGVGPYTAGAVASIAFGVRTPAVDGNVRRVLARLMDDPSPTPARLRDWAQVLVDPDRPGDFNQALMELGSSVCSPRSPDCEACPLAEFCAGRARGRQEDLPRSRRRRSPPHLYEAVAVVTTGVTGVPLRVLLRRRPPSGLLAGMWECPGLELASSGPSAVESAVWRLVSGFARAGWMGEALGDPLVLPTVDHSFSHRKMSYHPRLVRVGESAVMDGEENPEGGGAGVALRWVAEGELAELPIPVAQRKILDAAMERLRPGEG
jgi:A/G-specific adenine glycosylase